MHQTLIDKKRKSKPKGITDISALLRCLDFKEKCIWNTFIPRYFKLGQVKKNTYASVEFLQRCHWCKLQFHVYYGRPDEKCTWWRASSPSAGMWLSVRSWFVSVKTVWSSVISFLLYLAMKHSLTHGTSFTSGFRQRDQHGNKGHTNQGQGSKQVYSLACCASFSFMWKMKDFYFFFFD